MVKNKITEQNYIILNIWLKKMKQNEMLNCKEIKLNKSEKNEIK